MITGTPASNSDLYNL